MRTSRGASEPVQSRRSLSGTGEWPWARCSCRNAPSALLSLRSTARARARTWRTPSSRASSRTAPLL
eukprot:5000239-Lingulodinium_polyedra.AAC.1